MNPEDTSFRRRRQNAQTGGLLKPQPAPHPPIPFHTYGLVFGCELLGGAPKTSVETAAVGFFAKRRIPELSLTQILPEQIRFVFESRRQAAAPTAFD